MAKLSLIGSGYEGRSKNINASRCVNLYPEVNSQDSKAVISLIGTPGTSFFSNGNDVIRGMHVFNDNIYIVSGSGLFAVNGSGTVSGKLGSDLQTSVGRVQMVDNGLDPGGDQLVIADGTKIYCYNVSTEAFDVIDIPASTICFVGGYFIADDTGGKFRVSDLYDGSTWDSLNFGTAEAEPDTLVSVYNNHGELWLFGKYTTEIWYQKGSGTPPFARTSGGVIDFGCAAPFSIAKGNNTIFWLGNKRNGSSGQFAGVFMADGYNARLISPPSINYILDNYSINNDAFAYIYTDEGHEFYELTFPSANATWVYDITTGFWHERSTYKDNPYNVGRHLSDSYCYFNGKHYVSDYRNSNILEMSSEYYKDQNDPIVSFRITDHLFDGDDLKNVFIKRLQIDLETGMQNENSSESSQSFYSLSHPIIKFISTDNFLYCLYSATTPGIIKINKTTLSIDNDVSLGFTPTQLLKFDDDNIVIFNSDSLAVYSISQDSITTTYTLPSIIDGIVAFGFVWFYTNSYTEKKAYKFDIYDGSYITITTSSSVSSSIFQDLNYIYILSSGKIDKVNPSTAAILDTISPTVYSLKFFTFYDKYFYYVTGSNFYRLNTETFTVETLGSTNAYHGPIIRNGNYLYASGDFHGVQNGQIVARMDLVSLDITEINIGEGISGKGIIDNFLFVFGYAGTLTKVDLDDFSIIRKEKDNLTPVYNVIVDNNIVYCNGIPYGINIIKSLNKDNYISLSWSDDGGHTWADERTASMGNVGEYKKRVIWNRLGMPRDRAFRLTCSSPMKKVFMDIYVDIEKGNN